MWRPGCHRAQKLSNTFQTYSTHCCAAGARCRRARRAFSGAALSSGCSNGARWRAAQWLENSAEQEVDAPVEKCYSMWEDRTVIPQWMPWIRTVEVRPSSKVCCMQPLCFCGHTMSG